MYIDTLSVRYTLTVLSHVWRISQGGLYVPVYTVAAGRGAAGGVDCQQGGSWSYRAVIEIDTHLSVSIYRHRQRERPRTTHHIRTPPCLSGTH